MVFFTCNKCGESLKKKDVEKHCNIRCRGPPFLTCIDCLKDFRDDYVKHTTCVSEKDRYSSQGLKGVQKTKQQLWVETVHDTCGRAFDDRRSELTPSLEELLIWLQDQSNIPDKLKTFSNYISNARRAEPGVNIEFVWNMLDKARTDLQAKLKAEREAVEAEKRKAKQEKMKNMKNSSDSDDSESGDEEKQSKVEENTEESNQEEPAKVTNGKKDKKKKRMVSESESVINGTSELRKTKKPKKNPENEEGEESSNLNSALNACHLNGERIVEEDAKLSKKERKEKKKREKYEAEVKKIELNEPEAEGGEEPEVETVAETAGKKGKKKKSKKNVEESAPAEEEQTETKETKKKGKKNKRQLQEESDLGKAEVSDKKKKNGQSKSLNEDLDMQQSAEFSWETAILQVLESKEEMSLKRLSKTVLNEYLVSLGDDAHVDEVRIMHKFHKKLDKMHNVLVFKDKVRLRTSRD